MEVSEQSGSRMLITGASGFIGGHLVEEAIARGLEVFAGVRPTSNTAFLEKLGAKLFPFDLNDMKATEQNLRAFTEQTGGFATIIHNAGVTKIRRAGEFDEGNGYRSAEFAAMAQRTQVGLQKFVYMSSIAALGPGDPETMLPIDEEQEPAPITPYGRSKRLGEELISEISDLPYIIVRPSAVYGPRDHKFMDTVVGMFSKGFDVRLGSRKQRLSFVHVTDLVRFVFDAAHSELRREDFNISDGHGYHQHELNEEVIRLIGARSIPVRIPAPVLTAIGYSLYTVKSALGKPVHLSHYKMREVTALNWVINTAKAQSLLNYSPRYDLINGLRATFQNEEGPHDVQPS